MDHFPVQVTVEMPASISRRELATAIMQEIRSLTNIEDDAGCDWLTDPITYWHNDEPYRATYIGSPAWVVCKNPKVATLVDAYNILVLGEILHVGIIVEEQNHDQDKA